MRAAKSCAVACNKKLSNKDKDAFVRAIDDEYTVHWVVDNLPVGKFRFKFAESEKINHSNLFLCAVK
jgi:hypothetical protein